MAGSLCIATMHGKEAEAISTSTDSLCKQAYLHHATAKVPMERVALAELVPGAVLVKAALLAFTQPAPSRLACSVPVAVGAPWELRHMKHISREDLDSHYAATLHNAHHGRPANCP
jgi:hypothetical protein